MPIHRLDLPRVVFLSICDADIALRNPIANALIDRIPASAGWAFQMPLYNGAAGMFYYCNPAFDMGRPDAALPYPPEQAILFYPKFERLMREHFGDEIFSTMAWDYVRENREYFDWLFFTDAFNRLDDIRSLADRIGRDRCVVANIITEHSPTFLVKGTGGMRTVIFPLASSATQGTEFEDAMNDLAEQIVNPPTPIALEAEAAPDAPR